MEDHFRGDQWGGGGGGGGREGSWLRIGLEWSGVELLVSLGILDGWVLLLVMASRRRKSVLYRLQAFAKAFAVEHGGFYFLFYFFCKTAFAGGRARRRQRSIVDIPSKEVAMDGAAGRFSYRIKAFSVDQKAAVPLSLATLDCQGCRPVMHIKLVHKTQLHVPADCHPNNA